MKKKTIFKATRFDELDVGTLKDVLKDVHDDVKIRIGKYRYITKIKQDEEEFPEESLRAFQKVYFTIQ